jgi:amino acid transporter
MTTSPRSTARLGVAEDDADRSRLRELGYEQELKRGLRSFENVAMGFAAISPVVALYGVVAVGIVLAGPAWVWVLPIALAGQCLFLVLYSELASEFPIANASYQWSRRLAGPAYGWFNGWVCLCAYAAANATIAYLGAPWALIALDVEVTPNNVVLAGAVLVAIASLLNLFGIDVLKNAIKVGIAAEAVASVGIGLALLIGFRRHDVSVLTHTFGAESLSGGSTLLAGLAALAVGGWVFLGFDACGLSSEETRSAARQVPRAVWIALLSVGAIVIVDAVALTLAHPRLEQVVSGAETDPVTTSVVSAFGSSSGRPFAVTTLIAFLACGAASQSMTARAVYSVARDGVLPRSSFLSGVSERRVPLGALLTVTVTAWAGLLLGLHAAAIGTLIAFGTAGIYLAFLLVAVGALVARVRGTWVPAGAVQLGRAGLVCNVLAVLWLAFETVNIAWPRSSIAPPGAPWYQVWAAPLVLAVISVAGGIYLAVQRPHLLIPSADRTDG